jgi:group I intron endonuclease
MGRPLKYKKITGIYKIQSAIKPERIYIGSGVNIQRRWWCHLSKLRNNKHENSKLQRHFNKYGEVDFQFSILLGCNENDLIKIEQYFIDSYNPFFNICKTAGSTKGRKGWNKGIHTGIIPPNVFKKGHIPYMKGKKFGFKIKRHPMSEEQKDKIRKSMLGKKNALKRIA